jgi:hypothetical protein
VEWFFLITPFRCSRYFVTFPPTYASFNQLDLPAYASQEELRNKLLTAIKEGSEGFGFA